MKYFLFVIFPFLFFSCKPVATEEQTEQFELCKKKLLENKTAYIESGNSQSKKDSLSDYIKDLESNNLEQLISKFEVEPENVNLLVYSVCEKADRINTGPSVEEVLLKADSMMKFLDSLEKVDSMRQLHK